MIVSLLCEATHWRDFHTKSLLDVPHTKFPSLIDFIHYFTPDTQERQKMFHVYY